MSPEDEKLLAEYDRAKAGFTSWKEYEQTLRKQVVARFTAGEKNEGVERRLLESGLELVMGHRCNYKVDARKAMYLEAFIPADTFAALFKISVDMSITAYRQLSDEQRKFLDYAVTIEQGMPTLEIKQSRKVI